MEKISRTAWLTLPSGASAEPPCTNRMSSAAFRPSPVILSMLSTDGSTFSRLSFSARTASEATNAFNSGVVGARTMRALPPSSAGIGSLSMSAVCTSAIDRNICISSGTFTNRANRVCKR